MWSSPKVTSEEGLREKVLTPDTMRFSQSEREGRGCREAYAGSQGDQCLTQNEANKVSESLLTP
jgi:hypothetical protein